MYPETKEEYLNKWVKEGRLYWKTPNNVIKIIRRTNYYFTFEKGHLQRDENNEWQFCNCNGDLVRKKFRIKDGFIEWTTKYHFKDGIEGHLCQRGKCYCYRECPVQPNKKYIDWIKEQQR